MVLNVDHGTECELSALKYLCIVGGLCCRFCVRVVGGALLSGLPAHPHYRAPHLPSIVEALDEYFEGTFQTVVGLGEVDVGEGGLDGFLHDDAGPMDLRVLKAAHIGSPPYIFVDAFEALDFGEDL